MSEILITKKNRGQIVDAAIEDQVIIRLEENLTTGYMWELENTKSPVFDLVESISSVEPAELMGAGGIRTFHFRVKSSGIEHIQFRLRRSWEPEDASIDHFDIGIKVS